MTHPTASVAELVGGFEQNTATLWLPIVLDSMWPPSPFLGFPAFQFQIQFQQYDLCSVLMLRIRSNLPMLRHRSLL